MDGHRRLLLEEVVLECPLQGVRSSWTFCASSFRQVQEEHDAGGVYFLVDCTENRTGTTLGRERVLIYMTV